jgi:hypothetical protein
MAFFLLSGPNLGSRPGICVPQAAAAREEQARLERVCGISHAPGCCTLLLYLPDIRGSGFRIMLLTCGAKGTRTPDPLLANNRQHVHPRPYPQVTIPGRASRSTQIQVCCCTFLLYSLLWSESPRRRAVPPSAPGSHVRPTSATVAAEPEGLPPLNLCFWLEECLCLVLRWWQRFRWHGCCRMWWRPSLMLGSLVLLLACRSVC